MPNLHLVLASATVVISCACALLSVQNVGPHCKRWPQHPLSNPNVTDDDTLSTSDLASSAFECPPPVPCPAGNGRDGLPKENGTLARGAWDLKQIPLAYRSRTELGQPGICAAETSQRAFLESGVDLDSLMSFEPCELFNLIQRRTLWILGDSQAHALFRALFSFMSAYARTKQDVGKWGPIGIPSIDYLMTVSDTGKTECVEFLNDTRICHVRMTRLSHKEFQYTMEILARAFPTFRHHVVVLNVGLHYRPVPYLLSHDLQALADYRQHVRRTMGDDYLPVTLWIDTPPQHFSTPGGEYDPNKNLTADACAPFEGAKLTGTDRGAFNSISDAFAANISDAHVRTWEMAKRSHFAHNRLGDCTHFCRPGVPELWLYAMTKTLAQLPPRCK